MPRPETGRTRPVERAEDGPRKPTTRQDYARRIARVHDLIAANLDAPLDIARLAEAACFSPFHFHRIYRTQTGETVTQTVRRIRLHRAAADLLEGRLSLERIARRAGYAGTDPFGRAFQAAYGISPAAFRDAPRDPVSSTRATGDTDMTRNLLTRDVTIETRAPLRLAGLPHSGSYQKIGTAFDKVFALAGGHGLLGPDTRSIGLYHDDPKTVPERALSSFAAVTVGAEAQAADLAPLEIREVAGGRYATVIHKGPYAELERTWDWLFGTWLPASGEEAGDAPALEDYLNDPRETAPPDLLTAVSMKLRD